MASMGSSWISAVLLFVPISPVQSADLVEQGSRKARSRISTRSVLLNEEAAAALYAVGASTEADSYQGLVGRPGIDFPVLTQIPRTIFDCKNHGNGYFADLETRCQVFHICDEGKKISFLCPNGTIFRQLDLICDWWFKVDCAATPNHYAESTEMLTQAKRARLQSKHPVPQPINPNDERLTTTIQDKRLLLAQVPNGHRQKPAFPLEPIGNVLEFNRRMDLINSAELPDGAGERSEAGRRNRVDRKGARKISFSSADEIQDTAQSASFASVAQKMFNSYYAHDKPSKDATAGKLRSENQVEDGSALHDRSTLPDPRDASAKGYSNNHAVNYIPYTTARKLNLSGKVTQFYTPTVPTFTTSAKTTVVESTTATAKATLGGGDDDQESHIHAGQPVPVRRDGTIDESVMDHAMEIMQTIKSLKIDDPNNSENDADGSSDALGVRIAASPRADYQISYYAPLKAAENNNGEVLDFSDVITTTTAQNPTETSATETTVAITSTIPTTTVANEPVFNTPRPNSGTKQGKSLSIQFITGSRNELADEVNGELGSPALANNNHGYTDHGSFEVKSNIPQTVATIAPLYSQQTSPSTIPVSSTTVGTTNEPIPSPHSELKPPIMPAAQYNVVRTPKTTQPLDDDEQLQRAHSESIFGSHHQRPIYERNQYSIIQLNNLKSGNNYAGDTSATSSTLTTTNANEIKSVESEKQTSNTGPPSRTTMSYTVFFDPLTINDELMELDKPKPTASHAAAIHQPRLYGWNGTLLNVPDAVTSPGSGQSSARLVMRQPENPADMQQKANEMFGDLNDAQADKLMNVMKMADKDKSMRRLILLLIRTCDDDPSTANEESRKALLDALINIDGVTSPHGTNELSGGGSQIRDQGQRRGKTIGTNAARILYDGPVVQGTHNYTATTENYATVAESNEDAGGSEAVSKEDDIDSDELPRESGSQTTVATTRMYSSSEARQNYQTSSGGNELRGRWAKEYDETQTRAQTTTPLPTTYFQTTTNTGSTIYTTTEPTTIPTTPVFTTSGSDYGSSTVATSTVSTTNRADGGRSLESFEADPDLQPPIVVSQRLPKDLSSSLDYPGSTGSSKKHSSPHYSDTRALELLKSLYSLAARWG
ncbi:hypothetical protein ZHAS_00013494 [Anopheles sinensis]|uniref:Chitin-binding type-2 domain-containing protein n=1 Tax=Anopheles sinensis TaxID=74873 RepID=A0A084W5Q2_ANOSI|nr:hypothetical protein ZHAS_00013494 [Anopheles sinensis]